MSDRELTLPKWAQELIRELRARTEVATEQLTREVVRLRPQVELLKARNEALTELLDCAARGGHKTAQEIMEIIRAYSLELVKEKR